MTIDVDQRKESEGGAAGPGNGNNIDPPDPPSSQMLRLNPVVGHKPDSYKDLQLEFNPLLCSSIEHYLPPSMLAVSRDAKVQYIREIFLKHLPEREHTRARTSLNYSCWKKSSSCVLSRSSLAKG